MTSRYEDYLREDEELGAGFRLDDLLRARHFRRTNPDKFSQIWTDPVFSKRIRDANTDLLDRKNSDVFERYLELPEDMEHQHEFFDRLWFPAESNHLDNSTSESEDDSQTDSKHESQDDSQTDSQDEDHDQPSLENLRKLFYMLRENASSKSHVDEFARLLNNS